MCGIVGLFAKSTAVEERLGEHLAAMLAQMNERGPDSAGVAVYRDPVPSGSSKLTLYSADPREEWDTLAADLGASAPSVRASHAVLVVDIEPADAIGRRLSDSSPIMVEANGWAVRTPASIRIVLPELPASSAPAGAFSPRIPRPSMRTW